MLDELPIYNSTFDIADCSGGPAGWGSHTTTEGLTISLDSTEKKTGVRSLRLSANVTPKPAQASCDQILPVQPDMLYELTYWAKFECSNTTLALQDSFLVELDYLGEEVQNSKFNIHEAGLKNTWSELIFQFKTSDKARFIKTIFRLSTKSGDISSDMLTGALWVDAVRIKPLSKQKFPFKVQTLDPLDYEERGPDPGSSFYELLYGPPSCGNIIANYSFELVKSDLPAFLPKTDESIWNSVYNSLKSDQPVEWIQENSTVTGEWKRLTHKLSESPSPLSKYCLSITNTTPGFSLRTRSPIAVDQSKSYRLRAFVKAIKLKGPFYLEIIWLRINKDLQSTAQVVCKTLGKSTSQSLNSSFSDWQTIEIQGQPPTTCQFAYIKIACETGSGALLIDDVVLEGFGDLDAEFIYSQAGYDVNGYKDVIVRMKLPCEEATLNIFTATGSRMVFSKSFDYRGTCQWGRHYILASFTEFDVVGDYIFEVAVLHTGYSGYSYYKSDVFSVNKNHYNFLLRKGAQWFYYQRSNCAVKNWHSADFMDDAYCEDQKKAVDLSGGWHDAGDMNKWTGMIGFYTWVLTRTAGRINDNNHKFFNNTLPDIFCEAAWGIKYLQNAHNAYANINCFAKWVKDGGKIPGSGSDTGRVCDSAIFSPDALAAITEFKYRLEEVLRIEKEKESNYPDTLFCREAYPHYEQLFDHYPLCDAFAMTTIFAIRLWDTTNELKYANSARNRLAQMASEMLKPEFLKIHFFIKNFPKPIKGSEMFCPSLLAPLAVAEMLLSHPNDKVSPICQDAFLRFCTHLVSLAKGPLGNIHLWDELPEYARYYASPARHCPYVMLCAAYLALGVQVLPQLTHATKVNWLDIAERNLQYAWGRNFAAISNMAQIGNKWNSQFTHLQAISGHEDGVMPGSVFKGHGIGRGWFWKPSKQCGGPDSNEVASMPTGFPHAILPNKYYTMHETANNEVWAFANACFLLAIAEVINAREII